MKKIKEQILPFITRLLFKDGTLSHKMLQSGVWVVILKIFDRGFEVIRTLVLAKILAPNDFGLFGIALFALSSIDVFSQTGFDLAIIQKKNKVTSETLNTAWVVQIIRGILLSLVVYLLAPFASSFFNEPLALNILRVLALSVFIGSFTNISIALLNKELDFKSLFIFNVGGTFSNLVVSIIMALVLRNAWALVFGMIAEKFIGVILSYFVHSFRPRLEFNKDAFKSLFSFGKYVSLQSIVLFFITQGDDAFVGKFLGSVSLGIYQLAYKFSNIPATEITHLISQVMFPAYAKIQHDTQKLKMAYESTFSIVLLAALPITGLIYFLANDFTILFLGDKWISVIDVMKVLALFGLLRSIGAISGPYFRAVARLDVPLRINTIQLIIIAILIVPLAQRSQLIGVSWAVNISMIVSLLLTYTYVYKLLGINIQNLFRNTVIMLALTVVSVFISVTFVTLLPFQSVLFTFLLKSTLILTFYSAGIILALHKKLIKIGGMKGFFTKVFI